MEPGETTLETQAPFFMLPIQPTLKLILLHVPAVNLRFPFCHFLLTARQHKQQQIFGETRHQVINIIMVLKSTDPNLFTGPPADSSRPSRFV